VAAVVAADAKGRFELRDADWHGDGGRAGDGAEGRDLQSFTFWLNVSAFCAIGGGFRGGFGVV
jgi:hypothetical protein